MNRKSFAGSEVDPYLIVSILVQMMVVSLIYFILFQLVFAPMANNNIISHGFSLFISLWLSCLIFTYVFFKTKWREMWFIDVLDNKALIVGRHGLLANKVPETDKERLEAFSGAREIHSGLHGKFPWEYPFRTINLETEIMIGASKDKRLEIITEDGITGYVEWQMKIAALPGFLTYLVRHDEEALKAFFTSENSGFIDRWFNGVKRENYNKAIESRLKEDFKVIYWGEKAIHPLEKKFGVLASDPQITNVDWEQGAAKAAQAKVIAANLRDAIKELRKETDSLPIPATGNALIMAATTAAGMTDPKSLFITGAEGLTGAVIDNALKDGGKKGK